MIKDFFSNLGKAFDHYSGRYQGILVKRDQYEECFAVRREIFEDELKRVSNDKKSLGSEDLFDESCMLFAGRDRKSKKIVATFRLNRATDFLGNEKYEKEYCLDLFPQEILPHIAVGTRLAVLPEFRKTGASLAMLNCGFVEGMKRDYWANVLVCEPQLYPLYRFMGWVPLSPVQTSPFGGYRLPIILFSHHYEYLEKIKSPFLKTIQEHQFPQSQPALEWQRELSEKLSYIRTDFKLDFHEDVESNLLNGVTEESRELIRKKAIKIESKHNDLVISKDKGGKFIGIVQSGALEVRKDGQLIVFLGQGDIFGEVSGLLDVPRTADIYAVGDNTQILLINFSILENIKNMADQSQIWKNIARSMASRLT